MAISGNATTAEGLPADFVRIFSWPTSKLVGVAVPDESGDWSHEVPMTGEYGLTYIAAGCQPITHGPYLFEGPRDPHWDKVVSLLHFYKGHPFDEKGHLWTFSNSDGFEYVDGMYGTALKNTNMNNRRLFSDLSGYQIVNSTAWTIDIQFSYLNGNNVNINGLLMIGDPNSDNNRYIQHISAGHRAWWNSRDARNFDIGDRGDGNMRLLSIVRDGSRQLGFIDGVKVFDSNVLFPTGASPIFSLFTRRGGGHLNNSMLGVIEQFRFTQGLARYTESFTPPAGPFPNQGPA